MQILGSYEFIRNLFRVIRLSLVTYVFSSFLADPAMVAMRTASIPVNASSIIDWGEHIYFLARISMSNPDLILSFLRCCRWLSASTGYVFLRLQQLKAAGEILAGGERTFTEGIALS